MQLFDLSGKVTIITGSTRGIGLGIAECLAASGAQVIVSSRSQADCDAIAGRLNAQFPATSSYGVACDVADGDSIGDLIAEVVRRSGGLDVLVCNAARMPRLAPFDEVTDGELIAQFDTNVVKTLRLFVSRPRRSGNEAGAASS